MWYLNRFDRGVVLNDVFVSKETKRVLKVHMVFLSKFILFYALFKVKYYETDIYKIFHLWILKQVCFF